MEKKIIKNFNKSRILEVQQNRDPFLMIDYAEEIVIEKSVKGYKDFNKDEWFWSNTPRSSKFINLFSSQCFFHFLLI